MDGKTKNKQMLRPAHISETASSMMPGPLSFVIKSQQKLKLPGSAPASSAETIIATVTLRKFFGYPKIKAGRLYVTLVSKQTCRLHSAQKKKFA